MFSSSTIRTSLKGGNRKDDDNYYNQNMRYWKDNSNDTKLNIKKGQPRTYKCIFGDQIR